MSTHQPTKITQYLVYFNFNIQANIYGFLGVFLGQKVVLCCDDTRVTGRVVVASIKQVIVEVFGDLSGFILSKTKAVFMTDQLEFPLSPTLLGRRLNFLGYPNDQMSSVLPIYKNQDLTYTAISTTQTVQTKSEEYIVEGILPKGEMVKINKSEINTAINLLDNPNLVLIFALLDVKLLINEQIINNLKAQNLDKISLILEPNDSSPTNCQHLFCQEALTQTSQYFAQELGFDVLVFIVGHSCKTSFEPSYLARLYDKSSVSVICL